MEPKVELSHGNQMNSNQQTHGAAEDNPSLDPFSDHKLMTNSSQEWRPTVERKMDPNGSQESNEEKPMIKSDNSEVSKKCTLPLVLAASAAVIGSSFQFGYNTGVINAPGKIIQVFINETYQMKNGHYIDPILLKLLWSFSVSIFAIGGMMGSFAAGYLAGRFGRKRTMLFNNVLAISGAVLMGCCKMANSYEMLIIGRFVIGINCGMNTGLAPLYLTEIAPVALRGALGTMNQLGIVTALLLSQVLGLSNVLGTTTGWPILLALTSVFALYQLLVLPFCPDSPQYLLSKSQDERARSALRFLRQSNNVQQEIMQLNAEQDRAAAERRVSIRELFRVPHLRAAMTVAIVMQLSQQLSGINAVFYYSTEMFTEAGVSANKSDLVTVGMGVANIVMTMVSLLLIEKLGRRILHLTGLGAMFVCSVVLVIALTAGKNTHWGAVLAVVFVLLFVVAFQTGPGSIPWFITAELFSQGARPTAISVAGLINWTGNFIVGIGYPPLEKVIHGYVFIIFAVLLGIFWIFTFLKVPETKGKSIEEITKTFRSK